MSDEVFRQLVGDFRNATIYDGERRSTNRAPYEKGAVLAVLLADQTYIRRIQCVSMEVSLSGIGLMVPQHLSAGTTFVLWLPDRAGKTVAMEYQVVRCERKINEFGLFHLGALFLRMHAQPKREPTLEEISAAVLS